MDASESIKLATEMNPYVPLFNRFGILKAITIGFTVAGSACCVFVARFGLIMINEKIGGRSIFSIVLIFLCCGQSIVYALFLLLNCRLNLLKLKINKIVDESLVKNASNCKENFTNTQQSNRAGAGADGTHAVQNKTVPKKHPGKRMSILLSGYIAEPSMHFGHLREKINKVLFCLKLNFFTLLAWLLGLAIVSIQSGAPLYITSPMGFTVTLVIIMVPPFIVSLNNMHIMCL